MNKKELIEELRKNNFSEIILNAFKKIKRELFIPKEFKESAYLNQPLPIAIGSTISQPYTIAFMLSLLELDKLIDINNDELIIDKTTDKKNGLSEQQKSYHQKNKKFDIINIKKSLFLPTPKGVGLSRFFETGKKTLSLLQRPLLKSRGLLFSCNKIKILEIGSGSGYVLALINEILKFYKIKNTKIYGIERIKELVEKSRQILNKNKNIIINNKDGSDGLKEHSPFDRILVSATFEKIPENLFNQLKNNGILVTPVRNSIFRFKKIDDRIQKSEFPGFVFVPVIEDKD